MAETTLSGEVIDLKELILTLWRKKWLIVGITLLIGLAAFLISTYLVPERFQATAVVTITDRNTWASLEVKGLPQLAESDQLLNQINEEFGKTDLKGELLSELTAEAVVRSQLSLQATAEDPDLAAEAANRWAELVIEKLNALYGTSDESLQSLEDQITQAETAWSEAQAAVEEYLSASQRDIYAAQLSAAQSALVDILSEIEQNQLLLSDAAALEAQLEGLDPAEIVNPGIALSLIILQGRAASGSGEVISTTLQDPALPADLTHVEVELALDQFRTALEDQNQSLTGEVAALEEEISDLALALEEEQYQVEKLKADRNLAETNYITLVKDLDKSRVLQVQEASYIMVSSSALPPGNPIGPNVLANTGFAGVSAALLTMLGIFFHEWWAGQEKS